MITMKENKCGSVNTRCLQSIASKCSVYQTNFNFFDQTKILPTSCSRHAHHSFQKTFFYHPTLLFMQDHSYTSIHNNKYLITA
jgi:hypothetical protein